MAVMSRPDAAVKRLAAAMRAQAEMTVAWLHTLPAADFERPTARPGSDVADVVGHMLLDVTDVAQTLSRGTTARPSTLAAHLRGQRSAAVHLMALVRATLADESGPDLVRQLDHVLLDVDFSLAGELPQTLDGLYEPLRPVDFLRATAIELVGHCDDLARSLPDRPGLTIHPPLLAEAARGLAQVIEQAHPGRSIELRVPPAVAVQIGDGTPGPTHTRGTPPSVVETDPLTFVRLCTGRLAWADALAGHQVAASGAHADLSTVFPV